MPRRRTVSLVLLIAGAVVLAVAAVRIGLYWVIDPLNEVLVPAAGLLLAAGLVAGALSLRRLRHRRFRTAGVLAAAGLLLGGLVRLVTDLPLDDGDGALVVLYGPGAPPSISWSLLWWQVAGPVLAVIASALLAAAIAAAIAGVARAVAARVRPA